jgi:branched-subunit amino acid aminotransferase/4-amino-4-deoxychorismate lyase
MELCELQRSGHWSNGSDKLTCYTCHDAHTLDGGPASLKVSGYDFVKAAYGNNTLCLACHAVGGQFKDVSKADVAVLQLDAGVAEAIMLNDKGHVAECTGDNLFIVKDGTAFTPPPQAGILIGITRGVVIKLAGECSVPLREQTILPADLYAADECFLTGTAAEVIPVTKIDGRPIGTGRPGAVSLKLSGAFRQYIASGNW